MGDMRYVLIEQEEQKNIYQARETSKFNLIMQNLNLSCT